MVASFGIYSTVPGSEGTPGRTEHGAALCSIFTPRGAQTQHCTLKHYGTRAQAKTIKFPERSIRVTAAKLPQQISAPSSFSCQHHAHLRCDPQPLLRVPFRLRRAGTQLLRFGCQRRVSKTSTRKRAAGEESRRPAAVRSEAKADPLRGHPCTAPRRSGFSFSACSRESSKHRGYPQPCRAARSSHHSTKGQRPRTQCGLSPQQQPQCPRQARRRGSCE